LKKVRLKSVWLLLVCVLMPALPAWAARDVPELKQMLTELDIAREIFRSAMTHAVGDRLRVTGVNAEYLPQQGALVSMSVVQPWIDVDAFTDRSIDLGREVETLEDVPELVYEIMTELNIAIAPYDPELLEELRELREEQKVVRSAQRNLRATLRDTRRAKNRAEDNAPELDEHIIELEAELEALVEDYEALTAEIDDLYAVLQERHQDPALQASAATIDDAVAQSACNYGDTFKSLGSQEFLNLAIRLKEATRYYTFRMEMIHECRRGDITPERLLESSWQYQR